MSWIKACQIFRDQQGPDVKYKVPKKGTDEYDKVKVIFDGLDKPPKKERVKVAERKKQVKTVSEKEELGKEIIEELKKKVIKKPKTKKTVKIQERDDADEIEPEMDETYIRTVIRNELIEHIKLD